MCLLLVALIVFLVPDFSTGLTPADSAGTVASGATTFAWQVAAFFASRTLGTYCWAAGKPPEGEALHFLEISSKTLRSVGGFRFQNPNIKIKPNPFIILGLVGTNIITCFSINSSSQFPETKTYCIGFSIANVI